MNKAIVFVIIGTLLSSPILMRRKKKHDKNRETFKIHTGVRREKKWKWSKIPEALISYFHLFVKSTSLILHFWPSANAKGS